MAQFEDRSVLYGPIYATEGVPAHLVLADGTPVLGLVALDLTRGIVLDDLIDVQTVRPAACFLTGDLFDRGIGLDELVGASLTLTPLYGAASGPWVINAHRKRESSNGISDGEILVLLEGVSG